MAHDPVRSDDDLLDDLFAQARGDAVPDGLSARVLADAADVQAVPRRATPTRARAETGWFAGLREAMGGWGPLSGVTAAGIVGVALGFYAPDAIDSMVGAGLLPYSGGYSLSPDLGGLWTEDGDV